MNTKYAEAYGDRVKKNDFYNGLTLYDSMFMNSSLKTTHSLSPKEYALLRALAVGLSETETCKILQLSPFKFRVVLQKLYLRFNVHNAYALVSKAKIVGVLSQENYVEEEVKEITHQFLTQTQASISTSNANVKGFQNDQYQFLLAYYSHLQTCFNQDQKKIPPKRD